MKALLQVQTLSILCHSHCSKTKH